MQPDLLAPAGPAARLAPAHGLQLGAGPPAAARPAAQPRYGLGDLLLRSVTLCGQFEFNLVRRGLKSRADDGVPPAHIPCAQERWTLTNDTCLGLLLNRLELARAHDTAVLEALEALEGVELDYKTAIGWLSLLSGQARRSFLTMALAVKRIGFAMEARVCVAAPPGGRAAALTCSP